MRAAGIDIGTTTISGVVLDTEAKKVLKAKTIQNGSFIKAEHEWEQIQDVSVIRTKACALLDELLEEFPDVEGIGLTGQMHGIVYLDKDGECVSQLYTWQDGRGAQPEFDGKSIVQEVYEKTGLTRDQIRRIKERMQRAEQKDSVIAELKEKKKETEHMSKKQGHVKEKGER